MKKTHCWKEETTTDGCGGKYAYVQKLKILLKKECWFCFFFFSFFFLRSFFFLLVCFGLKGEQTRSLRILVEIFLAQTAHGLVEALLDPVPVAECHEHHIRVQTAVFNVHHVEVAQPQVVAAIDLLAGPDIVQ